MIALQSALLRTEGEVLELVLTVEVVEMMTVPLLQATLSLHDDVMVSPIAWIKAEKKGDVWVGRYEGWKPAGQPRLIQLVQVQTESGELVSMPNAHLFLEPPGSGMWATGEVAEAERLRMQMVRKNRFESPLFAAGATSTDPVFTVVMLAENLHLTIQQRVPGIHVLPIEQSGLGADVVNVLNAVLQQLGFRSHIDPNTWMEEMRRLRPAAILRVRKVHASSPDAAIKVCQSVARQLLDLFALRRGDTPRLLGGVVGVEDGNGIAQCTNAWIEGPGYTGNVIGGFISGEDHHGLMQFWEGLSKEPRARLWLSLYADAIADQRWDYRLFRCFNLLEGVATEIIPNNITILDDKGTPRLQDGNKPYTTKQARGKVYELLRRLAAKTNEAESNFTAPRRDGAPADLWAEIGMWVSIRNAVAHRGSWKLPEGEIPAAQHASVEAEITARGYENTLASGIWNVVHTIRIAVESTLRAALRGQLSFP